MEPTTETSQNNDPGVAPDRVELKFDTAEAQGVIALRRHAYGAEILVDGIEIGLVDLFHRAAAGKDSAMGEQRGAVVLHLMRTTDTADGDDYGVRAYHHCVLSLAGDTVGQVRLRTSVSLEREIAPEVLSPLVGYRSLDIGEQPWPP